MKKQFKNIKRYSKFSMVVTICAGITIILGFILTGVERFNCDAQAIFNQLNHHLQIKNLNNIDTNYIDPYFQFPSSLQNNLPSSSIDFKYSIDIYGRIEVYHNQEEANLRARYFEAIEDSVSEIFTVNQYGEYVAADLQAKYHYTIEQKGKVLLIARSTSSYYSQLTSLSNAFEKTVKYMYFTQNNKMDQTQYNMLSSRIDQEAKEWISNQESEIRNNYITVVNNKLALVEEELTNLYYTATEITVEKFNVPQYQEEYVQWNQRLKELKTKIEDYESEQKRLEENRYERGIYKVGTDIPVGEYIVFNGIFNVKSGPQDYSPTLNKQNTFTNNTLVISVKEGEYIHYSGSGYFYPIELNPTVDLKKGGIFKVGVHIPAGKYRIIPENSNSYTAHVNLYNDSYYRDGPIEEYYPKSFEAPIILKEGQYVLLDRCTLEKIEE